MKRKIVAILFVSGLLVCTLFFTGGWENSNIDVLKLSHSESLSFSAYSIVSSSNNASCWHNDRQYEEGAVICIYGQLLECVDGRWKARGSC